MEYEIKIETDSLDGRDIVEEAAERMAVEFEQGGGYTTIVLSVIRPFPAIPDVLATYKVDDGREEGPTDG